MIHAYHVILPCYGCWLPNDPRGSWSEFIGSWEIAKYGETTRSLDQRNLSQLMPEEIAQRKAAQEALLYPPVVVDGYQALSIANGFAKQSAKSGYSIWACAILPEHTHLVIARHRYKVEQVANLLKGAATRQLVDDARHPFEQHAKSDQPLPQMWARYQWKVYLHSEEAIENAIAYVIENPIKEGKPKQVWSWVTPLAGVDKGWVTYE